MTDFGGDGRTPDTNENRAFRIAVEGVCPDTDCAHESAYRCSGWSYAEDVMSALALARYVVIADEPNHYVTFDENGWFIEHSVACRVAGTLGTCVYNVAIREIAEDFDPNDDPDQLGRWLITNIDSEGLPSLVRADVGGSGSRGDDR